MLFNVAIRTVWLDMKDGLAEYGVGGSITWDSVAEDEYAEAEIKSGMNIKVDILGLKHRVEMMQGALHYNSEISKCAKISKSTFFNFIKNKNIIMSLSVLTRFARYFTLQGLTVEIGDFFCWQGEELLLNIGSLIKKLDPVPTDEEVARNTGIPLSRVNNLVRGNVKRVYLADLAALLAFFRQRGVEIELGDLLREEESEKELV